MTPPVLPSNKSFGITFTAVFALVAGWLAWRSHVLWMPFAGLSAIFLALALAVPAVLAPLNRLWMRFGALLNRVVSPVILGVIFFGMFMPVALFFRLKGRDALHRRFDKSLPSYWTRREPPGPDAEASFPRQF